MVRLVGDSWVDRWTQLGSCTLQCKQLNMCTQSVQLNIGPSKVCAQVSTKMQEPTQIWSFTRVSDANDILLFSHGHRIPIFSFKCFYTCPLTDN